MSSSDDDDPILGPKALTVQQLTAKLNSLSAGVPDAELQLLELPAGEVLFREGDKADSMYLLMSGSLAVRVAQPDGSEQVIDTLGPGEMVGELALLSGRRRTATVYAIEDAGLIRLDRAQLAALAEPDRAALLDLDTTVAERWQRLQLAEVLTLFLGDLSAEELHYLQSRLEWRRLANGDVLFTQGEPGDGMYLVVNGRLRYVVTDPSGASVASGEFGPGESLGEFALLTDELRSATVSAVRETNVVRMSRPLFEQLLQSRPELMGRIARIIVERMQRAYGQRKPLPQSNMTLTVLPAGPGLDAAAFAADLAESLRPFGAATTLDSHRFDQAYGSAGAAQSLPDDPANPAIVSWLGEFEAEHNFLVFAGDHGLTPWTRRCIGQADRVLVLADPRSDPAPTEAEQLVSRMEVPVRTELVLWHPADTDRPKGTSAWLDQRTAADHHHLRMGSRDHMDRLARRLTGNAVALVLSGGSARGFAHMGVHRALEELGIPVDYVGGTSMGAVMGGSIVTRETNADIVALAAALADPKRIFDRTLPITAIMASNKVTNLMREAFGEALIEDQWIPFYCVAANLTTAEREVYRRGPLWRAIRASLSIPAVFAPVMSDGDVLVDGGVMDNFPVLEMANRCESTRIIGVNVSPHREKKRYYDMDAGISGWRVLLSRLNPFRKSLRTPSLIGMLMRTMEINSIRHAKEAAALADLLIVPDVRRFGSSEYDRYEEISRAGYEAALEPLRAWNEERLAAHPTS